jgi:hypothetical protein
MTNNTSLTYRLEAWYAARCDGEWEHANGIKIKADADSWSVEIDIPPVDLGFGRAPEGGGDGASWTHTVIKLLGEASSDCLVDLLENFLGHPRAEDREPSGRGALDALVLLQRFIAGLAPEPRQDVRICISTIDNPGWQIHAIVPFVRQDPGGWVESHGEDIDESDGCIDESDWCELKWSPPVFEAYGSPYRLSAMVMRLLNLCGE